MSRFIFQVCWSNVLKNKPNRLDHSVIVHRRYISQLSRKTFEFPSGSDPIQKQHKGNDGRNEYRNDCKFRRLLHAMASLFSVGAVVLAYDITEENRVLCSVKQAVVEEEKDQEVSTDEKLTLDEAIEVAKDLCLRIKDENGSPGLAVAVSINGKEVWSDGFGYADLENRVPCRANSVIRIASISKPITMTAVAKLWEEGKLDLDKPVSYYVPSWPEKTYNGKKVDITTRLLVSHLAGVRHYDKNCGKKKDNNKQIDSAGDKKSEEKEVKPDTKMKEFYSKRKYSSISEALNMFKNDELCSLPGTEFLYTTHGWTLISAVVEGAAKKKFPTIIKDLFKDLGMENTYLDESSPLIYNRARHYVKNKHGRIINAPYVDLSAKWAGGGFLSTVQDLNRFGNIMLFAYQNHRKNAEHKPEGYLRPETVDMIWTPNKLTKCDWDPDAQYAMGWAVARPGGQKHGQCREVREYFSHTGGAVGATSVLLVLPKKNDANLMSSVGSLPNGVVVSIISNLSSCRGIFKTALHIAQIFENVMY